MGKYNSYYTACITVLEEILVLILKLKDFSICRRCTLFEGFDVSVVETCHSSPADCNMDPSNEESQWVPLSLLYPQRGAVLRRLKQTRFVHRQIKSTPPPPPPPLLPTSFSIPPSSIPLFFPSSLCSSFTLPSIRPPPRAGCHGVRPGWLWQIQSDRTGPPWNIITFQPALMFALL